jgi:hypothetical protein
MGAAVARMGVMARKSGLPRWLTTLFIVVGVIVLGPPLLALALAALGVVISLSVSAFKLAVIGAGIYGLVLLLQAIFSKASSDSREDRLAHALDKNVANIDQLDAEKQALDQEWERAVADARKAL